jgi:hypothetical protein
LVVSVAFAAKCDLDQFLALGTVLAVGVIIAVATRAHTRTG